MECQQQLYNLFAFCHLRSKVLFCFGWTWNSCFILELPTDLKTVASASLVLQHLKDLVHICLPNNLTQLPSLFMIPVNDKDEYIA